MTEHETNCKGIVIQALLDGVRKRCAIKAVLAEYHHGEKMRNRPRPIHPFFRFCFEPGSFPMKPLNLPDGWGQNLLGGNGQK
jgi:hypothetical protein